MKMKVEGKIIGSEMTKKGGCMAQLLGAPDAQGGQEVFKVYSSKPLPIGSTFKGILRGDVEMWFIEGA